jgi:uncharacterized membrane protein YoaK (UPF0700 family)
MYVIPRKVSLSRRIYRFFNASVREEILLEFELLMLAFATGLNDASTYSEYRVFTANHTGNTILLAVGITEASADNVPSAYPVHLTLVALSLSMFLIGAMIQGQLGNFIGCRKRWWLITNNVIQTFLVLTASLIQARNGGWGSGPIRSDSTALMLANSAALGPYVVALLALSAGGQVGMARSLQMTEISTANATSTYVDILIDSDLFRLQNRKRNRRVLFLASLTAGSFAGGAAYQTIGSGRTLFCSAIGKVVVTILLLLNPGTNDDEDASESQHKKRRKIK